MSGGAALAGDPSDRFSHRRRNKGGESCSGRKAEGFDRVKDEAMGEQVEGAAQGDHLEQTEGVGRGESGWRYFLAERFQPEEPPRPFVRECGVHQNHEPASLPAVEEIQGPTASDRFYIGKRELGEAGGDCGSEAVVASVGIADSGKKQRFRRAKIETGAHERRIASRRKWVEQEMQGS